MSDHAARVRARRPFLCRTHLWHRWAEKKVQMRYSGGVARLWVCSRCRTAHG